MMHRMNKPTPNTAEFGGIYRADFYCEDCIEAICAKLDAEGKTPKNLDDEHSYDSDYYPKLGGNLGESDCPQHCGNRDCPHSQDEVPPILVSGSTSGLNPAGVYYVTNALDEATERTACLDQWALMVDGPYLIPRDNGYASIARYWGLPIDKITAKEVKEITVIDPDTGLEVEVMIYKLSTGPMVGIDSSFISNTDDPVYSPFDKGVELEIEE